MAAVNANQPHESHPLDAPATTEASVSAATASGAHGDAAPGDGSGVLVLAGTPIGDVRDAPPRLSAELARADVVAAEDTRRLRRLTQALGVQPAGRVVSYFEGNESARTPELADALQGGARVLLVTDAGMPSVSDPGYRLVAAAVERGIRVTAVPGPSAVLTALALSGLPVDRFCFEGFLPRKAGERMSRLREVAGERRTLVYFEAPHRLDDTLTAMAEAFGAARPAAVCRELTKTYEEVRRGGLGELALWAADGVRGEITIVVQGAPEAGPAELDDEELVGRVRVREDAGERRKEAIAAVAAEAGLPKRQVFDAVVAAKNAARGVASPGVAGRDVVGRGGAGDRGDGLG
ncbi:16S rRNA (cytidine(1402)-2'-O)-methyltransferase [Streptomyces sp. NRRL F-5126]|uniref:16S rRNA (cytidine(1402)-2'-O)-methyltransferase n=1 Tax=Streptomyces sp. NRRL F-5126 TaxID=1463857 RepID=UPI00099CBDE2|nr:16S rRNA (cytidine(1402)-2'-O)-methyltransferase [Streptomyces sp. NRRL F-5126]